MLDKIIKNYGLLIYAYIVIIFEIVSFCKYTLSITVEKVFISRNFRNNIYDDINSFFGNCKKNRKE